METDRYLTAVQLRQRLGGVSEMTLDRWLKDERLAFPRPLVINRRRLFKECEIVAWEDARRVSA